MILILILHVVLHKVLHKCCTSVAQGSILRTLLFNIDIRDFFRAVVGGGYYKCDIASYADDNARYTSDSLNLILEKLESSTRDLFRWFNEKI